MAKQRKTKPHKSSGTQNPLPRNRRQARAYLLRVAPHMIKPGMIRTIIRRSLTKQTKAFRDKLNTVLVLVDQLYDLEQQEGAMNPGLIKAQRDGSIKRQWNEAARALAHAWKELLDEFTA